MDYFTLAYSVKLTEQKSAYNGILIKNAVHHKMTAITPQLSTLKSALALPLFLFQLKKKNSHFNAISTPIPNHSIYTARTY